MQIQFTNLCAGRKCKLFYFPFCFICLSVSFFLPIIGAKSIVRYTEDLAMTRFVKSRFHAL